MDRGNVKIYMQIMDMEYKKKGISLLLVITKLNLAFRVRNHLYVFNLSEGELKRSRVCLNMMGQNCSKMS